MRSPILALTGLAWRRHRWPLLACVPVWLTYALLARLLAPGQEVGLMTAFVGVTVAPVMAVVLAVVACIFAFVGNAAIEARESAYPAGLFTLPVATRTLVFWPMLQGSVAVAAVTSAWTAGIWSFGAGGQLTWLPAGLAAVGMAWLQAAAWRPYPAAFLRLLAIPVLALTAFPLIRVLIDLPWPVAVAVLAGLWAAAYGVALRGVARARRGATPHWRWPGRLGRWLADRLPWRRTGFASAVEAQAWFEWRLRGWGLPMVAVIGMCIWLPLFPFWPESMRMLSDEVTPTLKAVNRWLRPWGMLLVGTLAYLPLYAGALGTDLGGMRFVGRRVPPPTPEGVHPLLGLKPLTPRGFVLAKWRMAARSTFWASVVVLLPVIAAYTVTGRWPHVLNAPAFRPHGPGGGALVVVTLVAASVVATWVQLVGGLWVGLTSRGWLAAWVSLVLAVGWLPLGYVAYCLWAHPTWLAWLPVVAGVAVLVKLRFAAWVMGALVRRGHATRGEVAWAAAAWVAFALACVGLVRALLPPERASFAMVALGVAVLLPFNRVLVAPLALAGSRHG